MNGDQAMTTGRSKVGAIIGSDCRLGIHVGMNPGVKIGSGSFIGGGSFVNADIPVRSFARMKDGILQVSENKAEAPGSEERGKYRP